MERVFCSCKSIIKNLCAAVPYSTIGGFTTMHELDILLELLVCSSAHWTNILPIVLRAYHRGVGPRKKEREKNSSSSSSSTFFMLLSFLQKESKWPFAAYGTFLSVDPINFKTQVLPHTSKLSSRFWSLFVP